MAFFFTKLIRNVILLIVAVNGIQFLLRWKSYSIHVKDFKALSEKAADSNSLNSVSKFTGELRRKYGKLIPQDLYWLPLSAGGLQLRAQFLYGDVTEYVVLFSAVGQTSGRAGFHWSNTTCTVLHGELSRVPDSFTSQIKETYKQGQNFRHGQFESHVYLLQDEAIVACYGRGFVPVSSIWTTTGSIASGDPFNAVKILFEYSRHTFAGVTRYAQQATDFVKSKAKIEL